MKNPMPINKATPEETRARGWQAESRDTDGHMIRTHARFENDAECIWFLRECMENNEAVTFWPQSPLPDRIGDPS